MAWKEALDKLTSAIWNKKDKKYKSNIKQEVKPECKKNT